VLEQLIRRDRMLMASGLAVTTVLAWIYLLRAASAMNAMAAEAKMHAAMGMADMRMWGASDWAGLFVMWAVMMVAMMLPSAAPMILLVLGVYRRRGDDQARASGVMFVAGYILAWTAFSAAAATLQIVFHRTALVAGDMRFRSAALSGVVLILAGIYQWLPVKNVCLSHCQSPLRFLSEHWREGTRGALLMGVDHGLFCVGCCWLLMALLFVLGVMNLFWIAALAAFVLLEKLAMRGAAISRAAGLAAAAWGFYLLIHRF
jgi:predicted metal-binding membrane protein